MRQFLPKRQFTRRDILRALSGRFRQDGTPAAPTGLDPLSKSIDDLIERGHFEQATSRLRTLLQKSPDHLQAQRKLGYCLLQSRDLTGAENVFASILHSYPHDPFALLYLGLTLARQGRTAEAIESWRSYFNTDQPIIQRAVNLQIALYDAGGPSTPEDMVAQVQEAVVQQQSAGRE